MHEFTIGFLNGGTIHGYSYEDVDYYMSHLSDIPVFVQVLV